MDKDLHRPLTLIQNCPHIALRPSLLWRLLLEEYGPETVHIKDIRNTVAYAISRLDSGPIQDDKANWMMFTNCWCHYSMHATSAKNTYDHFLPITANKM